MTGLCHLECQSFFSDFLIQQVSADYRAIVVKFTQYISNVLNTTIFRCICISLSGLVTVFVSLDVTVFVSQDVVVRCHCVCQFGFRGPVMVLPGSCRGPAVVLLWYCRGQLPCTCQVFVLTAVTLSVFQTLRIYPVLLYLLQFKFSHLANLLLPFLRT